MDSPFRGDKQYAGKKRHNQKTNGEKTLTFNLYKKVFSDLQGDFVDNLWVQLLTNESKIKLKDDEGEWHDLVIKSVSPNSTKNVYSYTAKDANVQELAKSGFELDFKEELGNNSGTANELVSKILEGTDWSLDDSSEHIFEEVEENLVKIVLSQPIYARLIKEENGKLVIAIQQQEMVRLFTLFILIVLISQIHFSFYTPKAA